MSAPSRRGIFLSIEGIEGCGKSTQAALLSERLSSSGRSVVVTLEPGGTGIGNRIREILLHPGHGEMSPVTELLLYNAARAQHLAERILPVLHEGKIVVTDRFSDSTTAYQGYGRGIDLAVIAALDAIATGNFRPDLTILLDLDVDIGLARNRGINKIDRIELEERIFHERVREGFLLIAEAEPERIRKVDASLTVAQVSDAVWEIVRAKLEICGT